MKKQLLNNVKRWAFTLIGMTMLLSDASAQLSGVKTIPGTYASLQAAISDLNANGVGPGGVTFNITAGYSETISATLSVTATGTAGNPIVFQKSGVGANPLITAYTGGAGTPGSTVMDGIWSLIGSDYVTINGIDLKDNIANTTVAAMMEYGYGMFKASSSNGCRNNSIRNCAITLNRNNTATGSGPSFAGSCGIVMLNSTITNAGTSLIVVNENGASSNNTFYGNTIQNCNNGIVLSGFTAPAPYTLADKNNDIGGSGVSTGNNLLNFGGGSSASNPSAAVVINDQWDFNASFNTIHNNNGSGVNHVNALRGIWTLGSGGASGTINNNTITLIGGGTTAEVIAIENNAGSKAALPSTISMSYNSIINCSYPTATSGVFYGIYNLGIVNNLIIRGNTFSNNSTAAVSGNYSFIYNNTPVINDVLISNNMMTNTVFSATSTALRFRAIQTLDGGLAAGTFSLTVDTNTLQQVNYTGTGENSALYISAVGRECNIRNNTITSNTFNSTGTFYGIYNSFTFPAYPTVNVPGIMAGRKNVLNNEISNITRSNISGTTYITYCSNLNLGKSHVLTTANNLVTNITAGGTSSIYGIYDIDGNTDAPHGPQHLVYNNTINNITCGSGSSIMLTVSGSSTVYPGQIYNNNISSITGTGSIIGIGNTAAQVGNDNYYNNVITNMVSNGSVSGLTLSIGPVVSNAYSNKIYNLTSNGGIVTGIGTAAGPPVGTPAFNIYNNLITDLKAPTTNNANAVSGITIAHGTTVNVHHNTVVLNATSTGTNFGSSILNMTATPGTIIVRNNIFVNNSTPNGTGITAVLRRASTALTNFATTSQNNLYYAGTVAFNRAIMTDGTNIDSTLAQYKARVGTIRDSLTITENVTFLSLNAANPDFLKPNTSIATGIESGALPIAGLTTGFGNSPRPGNPEYAGLGGLPDLGAIEGDYTGTGTGVSMIYDSLTYKQITGSVLVGPSDAQILRISVYAHNGNNALAATSFKFTTTGTTLPANITAARVYTTAGSAVFSNASLFGSVNSPAATFYVTGARGLAPGINYFWLVYDVNAAAPVGNLLDATLDSIIVGGTNYAPVSFDTLGSRMVNTRLSGNYDIGVGKTSPHFANINTAIDDLTQLGVSGPVTFTLTDATYNIATTNITSLPLTIPAINGASAVNTITFRPAAATTVTITGSSSNSGIFHLNGANYIILDGRQGGSGTPKSLTVQNTNASGSAVTFINDASNNTLQHAIFKGQSVGNTIGVITWATGIITGNDSNNVNSCDIGDNGSTNTPAIAIASMGSVEGTTARYNDYNSITNCNIYNFWNTTSESGGVKLNQANNYWTITDNSFYQTSARSGSSVCYTFNMNNTGYWDALNGIIVTGNYIGGSAPLCGGTPWTLLPSSEHILPYFRVGGLVQSRFSNNTMANFSISTTATFAFMGGAATGGAFGFCHMFGGKMDIDSNTFGSLTDPNSIIISAGNGAMIMPILHGVSDISGVPGAHSISYNRIGGVKLQPTAGNVNNFTGISLVSGTFAFGTYTDLALNVRNNIIGGSGSDNIVAMSSTSNSNQAVRGISSTSVSRLIIDSNIIQNLSNMNTGTGTGSQVIGIASTNGNNTITNNRIDSFSNTSPQAGTGASASVIGILCTSNVGSNIAMNQIYGLHNAASSGAVQTSGIHYSGNSQDLIQRNFIHTLTSASPASINNGIVYAGGSSRVVNNMIRLGINRSGTNFTTSAALNGIVKTGGNMEAYFNSVYIGGDSVTTNVNNTFAFNRTGAGTDIVLNNIFVNDRTNLTTGGSHYAIGLNNNASLTLNTNLYHTSGTTLGLLNGVSQNNLATWKTATALDASSASGVPGFVYPTAKIDSVNLHISGATPLEKAGSAVSGYGTEIDFDGQMRNEFGPVDIGADADNFVPVDLSPAQITYTPLPNTTSTADRTIIATITDATGIYMTGTLRPRIFYSKQGSISYVNTLGVLVSGTATNSVWSFTIQTSLLPVLSGEDSVFYYIAVQDSSPANNLGSSPSGIDGPDINLITVHPVFPNVYRIIPFINGTFKVGVGEIYTSLTGNNGMFNLINNAVVDGNITIEITSNIKETATFGLNEFVEAGTGGYTIRIVPDAATERVLYSSTTAGMIRLNGADRVTFDGRYAGSGRYLKLVDTSTAGLPAFVMQNDAHRDTLMYCTVLGNNTATGDVLFGACTSGTGNDSSAVMYCRLGSINRTTLATNTNISSATASAGTENSENTIAHNEFFHYKNSAINLNATATGNNWMIYNNTFYVDSIINPTVAHSAILVQGGGGHIIRKNSIGGSLPGRAGSAYTIRNPAAAQNVFLIYLNTTSSLAVTIDSNIIGNITNTAATIPTPPSFIALYAIYTQATNAVTNISANTIGNLTQPADSLYTSVGNLYGIIPNTGPCSILNNTIGNLYNRYANTSTCVGITMGNAVTTIRGNTIHDILSTSTATTFTTAGILLTTGTPTVDKNIIYNIRNANLGTAAYTVAGISQTGGLAASVVSRNRISNISALGTGTGTSAPQVAGIYTASTTGQLYHNNQIHIGSDATGQTRVYGIYNNAASGAAAYYYNSILVTGTTSAGPNNSYAIYRSAAAPVLAWNNIAYNTRTTNGTGLNYAFGTANLTNFTKNNLNYNLFVVSDTNKVSDQAGNTIGAWAYNNTVFLGYGTYNTNWIASTTDVPADSLFTDTLADDLSTRNDRSQTWYVNGKGCAINTISGDFNNNNTVRSISISAGSTDIGSMEITPTVPPVSATPDKAPALNDSTIYSFGSRAVAKVVWGSTGTLPTSLDVKFYSGVNPSNTFAGATFMNAYWNIVPTGGTGYATTLSLLQDSALFGTVTASANLKIARYVGPGLQWASPFTTSVNNTMGTMSSSGISSFGIYTGTDGLINPLPVKLISFKAVAQNDDVLLTWSTASEYNNEGFAVERSEDGKTFMQINFVKSKGNSSGINTYSLADNNAFTQETHSLYYRLRQQNSDGSFEYSNIEQVSRNDKQSAQTVSAYPNPFNNQVTLNIPALTASFVTIKITDIRGKQIIMFNKNIRVGTNEFMVEHIETLESGIYFLSINSDEGTQVLKLIKH